MEPAKSYFVMISGQDIRAMEKDGKVYGSINTNLCDLLLVSVVPQTFVHLPNALLFFASLLLTSLKILASDLMVHLK